MSARSLITSAILLAIATPALAQVGNIMTTHNTTSTTTTTTTTDDTLNGTGVTGSINIGGTSTSSGSSSGGGNSMLTTHGNHHFLNNPNNPDGTDPNFPYDSTHGQNRSDLDTPRRGFDDPRDPWDGRYSNDNPANYSNDGSPSVNGAASVRSYSPGAYGTTAVHNNHSGN